jgi:hypothetical protein
MRRLDRVRWSAGVCFASYGRRIGVRTNDPALLERLPPHLPPDWQPVGGPHVDFLISLGLGRRGECRLFLDHYQVEHTADLDWIFERLENELQMYVGEHARDRIFIHAGVVGWKGQALLIPGRSMAGKSTLVEALVRAGATYYSDEYAVLDDQGQVYPYARRLSLRPRDGAPARRCTAEDLGGRQGDGPLPVRLVAVTNYRKGTHCNLRPLTPGQTMLELMNNTLPAITYPERVLTALQQVAPRARAFKGPRGDADETARHLLLELDRENPL